MVDLLMNEFCDVMFTALPSGDGTLNREHFELPLSNTTPPTNTSQSHQYHLQHQQPLRDSSLTKDKSSKALPDPIHRHQSPVNASVAPGTASNYVNLESLNSARGKAPKRPPRSAQNIGYNCKI